jgi:hypothetical protein
MSSLNTVTCSDRSRLIDILVRHGLTAQAAQAVIALGQTLRAHMLRESHPDRRREHGGMLDTQTGEQIGPVSVGTHTGVSFAAQIAVARERQSSRIAAVHTHPGNSSFSAADAGLLAQAPLVAAMIVTGADGTWCVISAEPDTQPPLADEIGARYYDVFEHLASEYQALVYGGSLTEEQAWQDLTHGTWEVIAPGLDLRYDRVTPVDDVGNGGDVR